LDEHEWLAERFEAERAYVLAVACRRLGSLSKADDTVREASLRLSHSELGKPISLPTGSS
jgi:RNA polymerase sigma-70 factor (ECF subfamily)